MSLVICRGPFYLPKGTFLEFLPFTGFVVNRGIVNFFLWAAARLVVGSGGQK